MSFFNQAHISPIDNIFKAENKNILVDLKREDKIHPLISGNKFRKLKYNIKYAIRENYNSVLTYGGAFSNHIVATAVAAKLSNLRSIGIIRGEEIEEKFNTNPDHNPTLAYAKSQGMQFCFISREKYRLKDELAEIEKLKIKYGDFFRIPEGGTNTLAVKGCEEILNKNDKKYDIICCCVGTGGTLAGIINASDASQHVLGFSALKGHKHAEIFKYLKQDNFKIIEDYEFGGYAKTNKDLVEFMNSFYRCTSIKLDPIYTGKMIYKLFKMIESGQISNHTKILAIHSGGIQGVKAFNNLLKSKNRMPLVFQ